VAPAPVFVGSPITSVRALGVLWIALLPVARSRRGRSPPLLERRRRKRNGAPALVRLPEIDFIDDGPGKPVGIQNFIGRRRIAAFANSDGDVQMLEWVTSGPGPPLSLHRSPHGRGTRLGL
jgi:hypothetical protein